MIENNQGIKEVVLIRVVIASFSEEVTLDARQDKALARRGKRAF